MGLGSILGSISPAFGMMSGKGLFGNRDLLGSISPLAGMASGKGLFGGDMGGLGGMGGLGMLMNLIGGHHGADAPNPAPAPVDMGTVPVVSPSNAIMAPGSLPQMGQPSAVNQLGSALKATAAPDPGLGPLQGPPQQHNSGILQSLMSEPMGMQSSGGGGLQDLLMRLGVFH